VSDKVEIEFIAGPTTPEKYRHKVGTKTFPFEFPGSYLPASGTEGTLMGIPGIMRDGLRWEIAEVDLRSETDKLLDEAAEILRVEPMAGDPIGAVFARQAKAQHLILKAQIAMTRRMR